MYHRLHSCGDGSDAFRKTFQQCIGKSNDKKAKRRIDTCYTERLIYDQLYKQQQLFFPAKGDDEHTQDKGHANWLNQTFEDFQSCFPHVNIKVELGGWQGIYPTIVHITRLNHGNVASVETYTKEKYERNYSPGVQCRLRTFANSKPVIKTKIQTFYKKKNWIKID